jgi:hypothetical protein
MRANLRFLPMVKKLGLMHHWGVSKNPAGCLRDGGRAILRGAEGGKGIAFSTFGDCPLWAPGCRCALPNDMQNAPRDSAADVREQKTAASDQTEANEATSAVVVL